MIRSLRRLLDDHPDVVAIVVMSTLIFAVYARSLWFGVSGWDDVDLYRYCKTLDPSFASLKHIFTHVLLTGRFNYYYRPILVLPFLAETHLPNTYLVAHAINIVFHLGTCLAFYFILKYLNVKQSKALFLSSIFAVHPALTSAVAWIPGRNDSMLGLCLMGSMFFLMKLIETGKARYAVFHLSLLAVSLFTKETAIIYLIFLAPYLFLLPRTLMTGDLKIKLYLCWFMVAMLWIVLRSKAVGLYPAQDLLNNKYFYTIILSYIGKVFVPIYLSNFPSPQDLYWLSGLLVLIAGMALLIRARFWRDLGMMFGVTWFAIGIISAAIFNISSAFEHRLYVPILGLLFMFKGSSLVSILTKKTKTWVCIIIILTLASCTFEYTSVYKNEHTFWNNAIITSPHNSIAYIKIANIFLLENKPDLVIRSCKIAYTISRNSGLIDYNKIYPITTLLVLVNDFTDAQNILIETTKANLGQPAWLYIQYAQICEKTGENVHAIELARHALRIDNANAEYCMYLSKLLYKQGNTHNARIYETMALHEGQSGKNE